MNTCSTCKWWKKVTWNAIYGNCTAIGPRCEKPNETRSFDVELSYQLDDPYCTVESWAMRTVPTFGCVLHEPRA